MISYNDVKAKLKKRLWTTYSSGTNGTDELIGHVNSAIESIAETVIRDTFIYQYTFTATGDRFIYNTPVRFSTKKIFRGTTELFEKVDWCLMRDALDNPDMIQVAEDKIVLPDSADVAEYTILYRGYPTKVTMENADQASNINLPENFLKALIPLAAYYGFCDLKQRVNADEQYSEYERERGNIQGAFIKPNENTPTRVGSRHKF